MAKKKLPLGYQKRDVVQISSPLQFRGSLLGLVSHPCKYDDGISVWVPKGKEEAVYWCIDPTNRVGDTITKVKKEENGNSNN